MTHFSHMLQCPKILINHVKSCLLQIPAVYAADPNFPQIFCFRSFFFSFFLYFCYLHKILKISATILLIYAKLCVCHDNCFLLTHNTKIYGSQSIGVVGVDVGTKSCPSLSLKTVVHRLTEPTIGSL